MEKELKVYCAVPRTPDQELRYGLEEERVRLILALNSKWVNGMTLTYYLFSEGSMAGSEGQMGLMRKAFDAWKSTGIGLDFKEVDNIKGAMVRVGFNRGDGSWSYIGRDILDPSIVGPKKRTMNIGSENSQTFATCVHEIGHLLGLPHEHQNPTSRIKWKKEKLFEKLSGPPNNWDKETITYNVLRLIDPDEVQVSSYDKDSVMHFAFEKGLIKKPEKYVTTPLIPSRGPSTLSETDKDRILMFYPPMSEMKSQSLALNIPAKLNVDDGSQLSFKIKLNSSAKVDIHTTGPSDSFLVLLKKQPDGSLSHLAFEDDSGEDTNASIKYSLEGDEEYVLQLRLYWMQRQMVEEDIQLQMTVYKGKSSSNKGKSSSKGKSGSKETKGRSGSKDTSSAESGNVSGGGAQSQNNNNSRADGGSESGGADADDSNSEVKDDAAEPAKSGCCSIL